MHSNEDDNPLYLFIQLKPDPHAFGRKMHIVETSIHMSFLTTFGWLCFKGRWLGVSIYIVSTTGNGIFWNQKCTACLVPMFKTILLNTSFIILFNLVFAQTVSIPSDYVWPLLWEKNNHYRRFYNDPYLPASNTKLFHSKILKYFQQKIFW